MCCCTPKLRAVIAAGDIENGVIDTSGSLGSYIRLVIRRRDTVLEVTPAEKNTGSNLLSYTATLDNLDEICVQVSCAAHFPGWINSATLKEVCHVIPDPNLGFVVP